MFVEKRCFVLLSLAIYLVTISLVSSMSFESLKPEPEDDSEEWLIVSDGLNNGPDGYLILKRGGVGGTVLKDILGKKKRNVGGIVLKDILGK